MDHLGFLDGLGPDTRQVWAHFSPLHKRIVLGSGYETGTRIKAGVNGIFTRQGYFPTSEKAN